MLKKIYKLRGIAYAGLICGFIYYIFKILPTLAISFYLLFYCIADTADNPSKKDIFKLVNENYDLLESEIQNGSLKESYKIKGIENIHFKKEGEKYIGTIEFYCGGSGLGSSTHYYDFYYNEADDMQDIWCAGDPLCQKGDGYYYKQPNGDNEYYTENIKGHFYYYEAHF